MNLDATLAAMGNTPGEVADTLLAANIRGKLRSHCDCPVARYLARLYSGHTFEVTSTRVQIDGCGRAVMPVPVGQFVTLFDCRVYPSLEER